MIVNFIFSVLLLVVGIAFALGILLFGVKFCKNSEELGADPSWKEILLQLVKGYPFWVWLIVFLAFQPAIVHILSTWDPNIWSTYDWIPDLSRFIGFIDVVFYIILFNITDDNGKFKILRKSK